MNRSLTFYELAAQVIPVLFLALTVDLRIIGPRDGADTESAFLDQHSAVDVLLVTVMVLAMAAGEFAALDALLSGKATALAERIVSAALLVGGWGVVLRVVIPKTLVLHAEQSRHGRAWVGPAVLAVQLVVPFGFFSYAAARLA